DFCTPPRAPAAQVLYSRHNPLPSLGPRAPFGSPPSSGVRSETACPMVSISLSPAALKRREPHPTPRCSILMTPPRPGLRNPGAQGDLNILLLFQPQLNARVDSYGI